MNDATTQAYRRLLQQISSYADFTEEEQALITAKFRPGSFAAREHLLYGEATCKELHFVASGLVRAYHLMEDKEITTYLSCDDGFISSYASFVTQSPSAEHLQCLEPTEVLTISHAAMQQLYHEVPNWQVIGRVLAESHYLCMADRVLKLQALPAREKYLDFLATAPIKVVQRTPLVHIASFLGITPESLSRIRKAIS